MPEKSSLHIAVNFLHAPKTLTGTGHYALQVVKAMLVLDPSIRITGICSHENIESFALPDIPKSRYKRIAWGSRSSSVMLRRLYEWAYLHRTISQIKPDIFWGPSNFLPWKKTCPYVATVHDMTFFRHPEFLPFSRRVYWHRWTHRTIQVADHITTGTQAAKEDILHYSSALPVDISVIFDGTSDAFYIGEDEAGKLNREAVLRTKFPKLPQQYVFFLGTLTSHKNVPRLVEAVAQAKKISGCENMELVLVGKRSSGYEHVEESIAKNNAQSYCHELCYVPDEDLPSLYEAAHLHVLPSFTEGFGLPITEAMAAGTPSITTHSGATTEVAGDAGTLIDPHSTDDLVLALSRLWTDEALWQEKRRQGLERAKEFTWKNTAQKTLEVLRKVAGSHHSKIT